MEDDAERWDRRHLGQPPPEPAPPDALFAPGLVDSVPTRGRALDVACGRGAQTLWAARRGLSVVALDVSTVAIDAALDAARLHGTVDRLEARVVDLDDGLPDGLGTFDLVICQRFRDVDVLSSLPGHVGDGGTLVATVLSRVGARDPGPFHAPADELISIIGESDLEIVHHSIGDGEESLVARRANERPSS